MRFAALPALALLVLSACGGVTSPPTRAQLRIISVPDTARVDIDERFAGSGRLLSVRPKDLTPGAHRVSVSAPGYFPHDLELELPAGETTVNVSLRAIPE